MVSVKCLQNVLKQSKQDIKVNMCTSRQMVFDCYMCAQKDLFSLLSIDCVYIDSQRADVPYFICAIKEFRMVRGLAVYVDVSFICQLVFAFSFYLYFLVAVVPIF